MKENYCEAIFYCREPKQKACRFFEISKEYIDCKHMDGQYCNSFKASCETLGVVRNFGFIGTMQDRKMKSL